VQLAGAFDCYSLHVQDVTAQRERVARTLYNWKNPGLKMGMQGWIGYMDIISVERMEEGREMMRAQVLEMGDKVQSEESRGKDLVQREADRRIEMCKRVVKRMLLQQLGLAWGAFIDCVMSTKQTSETVRKVLARMMHRQLAGAFDCYSRHVDDVKEQRERVQRTMARWRTPGVKKAFDRWLDFVDITMAARDEEATELAKQELLMQRDELEAAQTQDMSQVQLKLREEVQRRVDQCKRVVRRMLQHQLMLAWCTFVDSIITVKTNRETVRKVLARMTHRQVNSDAVLASRLLFSSFMMFPPFSERHMLLLPCLLCHGVY